VIDTAKERPAGKVGPQSFAAERRGRFCFECKHHPDMDADKEPCYTCLVGHEEAGWDHPLFEPKHQRTGGK